jgi:hypothetical protein
MTPIWILDRTPGATETVAWKYIYKNKDGFVIWYDPHNWASRWVYKPRKKPFAVSFVGHKGDPWSYHKTLEAAFKAAQKYANEK